MASVSLSTYGPIAPSVTMEAIFVNVHLIRAQQLPLEVIQVIRRHIIGPILGSSDRECGEVWPGAGKVRRCIIITRGSGTRWNWSIFPPQIYGLPCLNHLVVIRPDAPGRLLSLYSCHPDILNSGALPTLLAHHVRHSCYR